MKISKNISVDFEINLYRKFETYKWQGGYAFIINMYFDLSEMKIELKKLV